MTPLNNDELLSAWHRKLPTTQPQGQELSAFAVGVEVGFDHARDLEKQDWSRLHHVMKKHGLHPGRTDDDLIEILDRHLCAAQPAARSADAERVNWLEQMVVMVRVPRRYGSGDLFCAAPDLTEGDGLASSDLRAKIDEARAGLVF